MKKLLLLIPLAVSITACGVNPQGATKAIEAQGMTGVYIGSWTMYGCGSDDNLRSTFRATGVNGKLVTGVVCSGWLKGYTIRYD